MNGELLNIIYGFFVSIFPDMSYWVEDGGTFNLMSNGLFDSLSNRTFSSSFYTNWLEYVNSNLGYEYCNFMYAVIAYIISRIIFFVLILLLFKLFKWIFNLIFKLFRLN